VRVLQDISANTLSLSVSGSAVFQVRQSMDQSGFFASETRSIGSISFAAATGDLSTRLRNHNSPMQSNPNRQMQYCGFGRENRCAFICYSIAGSLHNIKRSLFELKNSIASPELSVNSILQVRIYWEMALPILDGL
jgi:hypothetical protein